LSLWRPAAAPVVGEPGFGEEDIAMLKTRDAMIAVGDEGLTPWCA